jgi:hypothetical protein
MTHQKRFGGVSRLNFDENPVAYPWKSSRQRKEDETAGKNILHRSIKLRSVSLEVQNIPTVLRTEILTAIEFSAVRCFKTKSGRNMA